MSRNTKGQVIEALDGWLKGKERHRIRHIKREEREREKKSSTTINNRTIKHYLIECKE
jgi:hypothetical protein